MATRVRLTANPLSGRVVSWKGNYGWIEPQATVEHPDMEKHKGWLFVHSEDVVPKWRNLTVGSLVEFFLYHDGQGLGCDECIARKVLRLTLAWEPSQAIFGQEGDLLPEFEERMHVTMRAYQWMLRDGSASGLPFLLLEVWGRPQNIVEAVLEIAKKDAEGYQAEMLVPESRLWKVHMGHLQSHCRAAALSEELKITDPMPCRSLTLKGARQEVGAGLEALIMQVCD
eukprot:gnl/TRDRNA2_/TRDRNA2_39680_c0_seq1.p1 gnl/TRDRNA2_/TRDRNA2_39680_c0~~gnl/TRDRNA2_/TRDRNA2_39680_c0_seq1.p1  ORF type:complete len:227 (+),score=36.64 gnl/TRDRNA2_/TRDRNA2_39680_c0_seq1:70-750(+)